MYIPVTSLHFSKGSVRVIFRVDFEIEVSIETDTSLPYPKPIENVHTIIALEDLKQTVDRVGIIESGTVNVYGKIDIFLFEIRTLLNETIEICLEDNDNLGFRAGWTHVDWHSNRS